MKGFATLCLSGLLFLPFAFVSSAQEKTLQKEPEVQDKEIESWVQDLGSANFDDREIATQKLLDLGTRALPFLEKAIKGSKDSEVRWNAKRLMREIRESGRPVPKAPRSSQGGGSPDGRMEDLMRQMERQQEEMRRMMDEHFRWLREGQDSDPWDLFTEPDSGHSLGIDELHERLRELEEKLGPQGGGELRSGQSFSLRQGPEGIRLEIQETVDGKEEKKVYEAKSIEEFREKYPEIAQRYGVGGNSIGGFRFHFGQTPRWRSIRPEGNWRSPLTPQVPELPWELPPSTERLGVEVDIVEPSLAAFLDLPEGVGLLVRRIEKGSLAEKMGVREKDVLLGINEKEIRRRDTILSTLRGLEPGAEISLQISRFGEGRVTLKGKKEKAPEPKPLEKVEEPK